MKKRVYIPGFILGGLMLLSFASFGRGHIPVTSANLNNDTVCTGASVYFVFGATDTSANPLPVITFAWQLSTDGGTTWSALASGAPYTVSNDSLTILANTSLSGQRFRCIATDSLGSDTSYAAWLAVDTANWGTISGPTTVCTGAQITLAGTVAGGAWSISNDTASITPFGVVTGLLANDTVGGNDIVFYYLVNACGSHVDTAYITVNPSPATGTISGPSAVCKYSTIALTESVTGGVWSRLHAGIDSVSVAGVVRGLSQGFDTVMYTTYNGLCYASAAYPVRVDTTVVALPVTGPSVSCVAHTIVLMNANVLGTWVWSASNGHANVYPTGNVYGVSGGLDTFTYSFTNSCNTVTSTATVRIDTVLNPGIIAGSSAVCAGSWIHLTESLATGFWISSNSSLAIVDGSGDVTGVAAGVPVISYVLSNGCGDIAATHPVTVSVTASAITGPDSVGIGSTISLSDVATGGSWSVADTATAHISGTGIVTGVASGSTTVSYTVTNVCGTSLATETVYVGPAPFVSMIDGPDSVCAGSSVTFTDTVTGGTWSAGSDSATVVSSGDSSALVTGVTYGQVIITYTVQNAFGTSTSEKAIYVNQPPVVAAAGPPLISLGGDYFLSGYPAGGSWSSSNGTMGNIVSTGQYDSVIVVSPGDTVHNTPLTYCSFVVFAHGADTLTYTYTNSCGTSSASFVISLPVSHVLTPVVNGADEALAAYPNPSNGELFLNLVSPVSQSVSVTITNMVGQKVQELNILTNKNYDINLQQPSGIYLVTAVTAEGNRYTTKITINR